MWQREVGRFGGVTVRLYGRGPSIDGWAAQLLDELNDDDLALIGSSMGGDLRGGALHQPRRSGRVRRHARDGAVSEIAIEELAARLGSVAIVDVRTTGEFDGSLGNPCDPRQGHIPGARHLDVSRLMELEAGDLGAELGLEPGEEIVAYCHSGAR